MQTTSIAFRRIDGQEELDKERKKFVKEGGGQTAGKDQWWRNHEKRAWRCIKDTRNSYGEELFLISN
jgi:hypothetical protein